VRPPTPRSFRRQGLPSPAANDGTLDPRHDDIDEHIWPHDIEEMLPGRPRPTNIDESKPARPTNIDENQWPWPGLGLPRPKHIDESQTARPTNIDENNWPLPGLGQPRPTHIDESKTARPKHIDEKPGPGHGNIDENERPGQVGRRL
jgi:hypothetical protein